MNSCPVSPVREFLRRGFKVLLPGGPAGTWLTLSDSVAPCSPWFVPVAPARRRPSLPTTTASPPAVTECNAAPFCGGFPRSSPWFLFAFESAVLFRTLAAVGCTFTPSPAPIVARFSLSLFSVMWRWQAPLLCEWVLFVAAVLPAETVLENEPRTPQICWKRATR